MLLWKDWFIWLNQFKINYSLTYVATVWKDQCISVNQFVLNYLYVVMESLMTKWLTLSNMLLWESNFNLVIESVHTKQLFLIHEKSFLWLNHAKRLSLSLIYVDMERWLPWLVLNDSLTHIGMECLIHSVDLIHYKGLSYILWCKVIVVVLIRWFM